jgi:DNA-binding MarR family transcriptional regulator
MSHELQRQAELISGLLRQLMRGVAPEYAADPAADLPLAQLRLCNLLYEGPRTMSRASRELGISVSAITQLADRLERAGMVERVADSQDQRVRTLHLTPLGLERMTSRHEGRVNRVREVLSRLPAEQREPTVAALAALVQAARADADSSGAGTEDDMLPESE